MRKLFTVGMLALLCSSAAAEVAQEDAAYFCAAEIAGGLAYDEVGRKWHGAVFKATERFVLRLKFVDTQKGVLSNDKDTIYKNFSVTVTEAGSNIATPCIQLGVDRPTVPIGNYPGFTCYVGYSEHSFNLANNRYLKVYDIGYTDGHDNNENTPAVSGGVCTKIDLVNDVRRASP
jgi:hypothetical protein